MCSSSESNLEKSRSSSFASTSASMSSRSTATARPRSKSHFTATTPTERDHHEDETPDDFLETISYLEKDAAMQRVNEELEKKSHEIFQKIEQYYSNKSLQTRMCEAGDAPTAPDESFHHPKSPPFHKYEDLQIPSRLSTATSKCDLEKSDLESLQSYDLDSASASTPSDSISVIVSPSHKKLIPSPDTKDVDIKARKRLQKATESVVQCLQSKLISHESRLADLYIQFRQKIQENTMLDGKIRALEDDRERLLKSMNSLQCVAEKSTKAAEGAKATLNLKMQAFAALKKDVDALRRDQKQKSGALQNIQTRLNRCLEENERLKLQNRSLQQNNRDKQTEDRLLIDELQQKVCQLEQQKSILNATVGKQAGLIKTLRQQRI